VMAVNGKCSPHIEDYFQVSAFSDHVDERHWDNMPCRVEAHVESP